MRFINWHYNETCPESLKLYNARICIRFCMSFILIMKHNVLFTFTADGRLERELAYSKSRLGEGSGITNELIIQTPQHGGSVLSVDSLLLHYNALLAASKVTVDMYDM